MKYAAILALVFILAAGPSFALESRNPTPSEPRLHLELQAMPSPVQQNFDRYVARLAAAARSDAFHGERDRNQEEARERETKVLNPIALFRW